MTSKATHSSRSAPKTDIGLNSRSLLFGRNTRNPQRPTIQFDRIRIGKPKQLYDENACRCASDETLADLYKATRVFPDTPA